MSLLNRTDSIFRVAADLDLQPSEGYRVTVYHPGGIVSSVTLGPSTTKYITLYPGHGFSVNDRLQIAIDITSYGLVTAVAGNVITAEMPTTPTTNDVLINLGTDTGSSEPAGDGSDLVLYDVPGTSATPIQLAIVEVNEEGTYSYYHDGSQNLWELVKDNAGTPVAFKVDAFQKAPQVQYEVRHVENFATSGTGTEADPWVTAGSNPWQAALDSLPDTGGVLEAAPGFFDLGDSDPAITIPILTSSTDKRAYTFRGAGRDLTFLRYSGTGSAFRYEQVNTGSAGSSWQSNQLVFEGFAIQQTGTARTGTAFNCNYISESVFRDLNIGNVRMDRQSGEDDFGWEYGVHFFGAAGDEVSDFNRFHNCYFMGNRYAMYLQNQADNTVIEGCSFEPRQDSNDAQDGVFIGNSSGITITGSHFNYFGKNRSATGYTTAFGLSLGVDISGVLISGNYFEGNSRSILLASDPSSNAGHKDGIVIQGNLFAMQDVYGASGGTYVYGIDAGQNSATYFIRGLVIQGNQFQSIGDYSRGIRICSDVKSFVLQGNRYQITAGKTDAYTNIILTPASGGPGAEGMIFERGIESNSTTDEQPRLRIQHMIDDGTAIILDNRSGSTGSSPRINFLTGSAGTQKSGALDVNSSGTLRWLANGVYKGLWDENGNLNTVGELRVGGDTGGAASHNTITNVSNVAANSSGVGTILFKGATSRDSAGFVKIYIGTTAYYVPVFTTITG